MKEVNKSFLSSIAFIDNAYSRGLFIEISKLLNKKRRSKIHIYCQSQDALKSYKENEFISSLQIIPSSIDEKLNVPTGSLFDKKSKKLEIKYKKKIMWYSASNRLLGRGFSPTAPNFPKFIDKKIPKNYVNYYYFKLISFWENEFEKKKIKLLISPGLVEANVGRKFGIINRTFNSSRYKSFYCWVTDEFWNNSMIKKEFFKVKNIKLPNVSIDSMPKWNIIHINRNRENNKNFKNLVLKFVRKIIKHIYWFKIKKNKRNYLLRSELQYIFRSFYHNRFISSKKLYDLKYLEKKKFIFFPLQVEPERNLQGNTPEFFNQFSAIVDISINLPADTFLVVKEHFPAAGARSKVFYNQLLYDFSNIIFVNANIMGKDLIKEARAIATINGTAGLEGAIIGKPVISFSKHNSYNFLDHVWYVSESNSLEGILSKILDNQFNHKKARIDGQKFVSALETISIDIPNFTFSNTIFTEKIIISCYQKLLETLK